MDVERSAEKPLPRFLMDNGDILQMAKGSFLLAGVGSGMDAFLRACSRKIPAQLLSFILTAGTAWRSFY